MVKVTFNQDAWEDFIIENNVVGFELKTLKSGRTTIWYINFRTFLKDLTKVDKAADFIYSFCLEHNLKPTNYFAVPEGPREFASSLNRKLKTQNPDLTISAVNLRAGYKTHGGVQDRYSVGPIEPWMKPVLLEDVGTTGSSVTEYLMTMQEARVSPLAVVSMANRCERRDYPDGRTVEQVLREDYKTPYHVMTDARRILPKVVERLKPSIYVVRMLREELKDMERYAVEIKI
jgi:orotate phosphoribosyltransferase